MDYSNHSQVLASLADDQEAEEELREEIDEIIDFVHVEGGQWEPNVAEAFKGRPRYTFDQTKPVISEIWAEMASNDYAAKIDPIGDGASEDVANLQNGLMRAIYSQSNFDDISTKAGKRMIMTGFGAWRARTKYIGESFYQDIAIEYVPDAHRRVWFDCLSEEQTREDANHVHILSANVSLHEAEKRWGKYKGRNNGFTSLEDGRSTSTNNNPKESITVGEILYKEPYKKTIYLLDDEEGTVTDGKGLEAKGLTKDSPEVIGSRDADCVNIFSRKYDGAGWLEDEKKTAFDYLPVIPLYSHFDIIDGMASYEGAIRNIMDACRIFNYSESKTVEEEILAMRQKLMVDNRIIAGYKGDYENLNRDPRAVQLFNGEAADKIKHAFGPMQPMGGAVPNPALQTLSSNQLRNIQLSTGRPNAVERARSTQNDSNFRADLRESMGQVGTFEYYRGYKIALEHTLKVCLSGFRKVYDTYRKIMTIDESGQSSEVKINETEVASGKIINNLMIGKYTATVSIGQNMESRKAQANDGIIALAQYDPSIISRNSDIMASNINAPGMDTVADRERAHKFASGAIPQDQWTQSELEEMQAKSQQPPPPDPAAIIAQTDAQRAQFDLQSKMVELELKQADMQGKQQVEAVKLELQKSRQDYENLLKAVQAEKISIENGQPIQQDVVNKAEGEI